MEKRNPLVNYEAQSGKYQEYLFMKKRAEEETIIQNRIKYL